MRLDMPHGVDDVPPPDGINVPRWVYDNPQGRAVMSEIITVGLDPLADRRMRSNRRQAGEECISGAEHGWRYRGRHRRLSDFEERQRLVSKADYDALDCRYRVD